MLKSNVPDGNIPEHKTYMRVLFILIECLVKQGLPLRGGEDFSTGDVREGLFLWETRTSHINKNTRTLGAGQSLTSNCIYIYMCLNNRSL